MPSGHWPQAAAVGYENARAGTAVNRMATGEIAKRRQHRDFASGVKTRQAQMLVALATQVKHRVNMPGNHMPNNNGTGNTMPGKGMGGMGGNNMGGNK